MKIAICTPFSLQHYSSEIPINQVQYGGCSTPSIEEQVKYFRHCQELEIHVISENEKFKDDVICLGNVYIHLLHCPQHFKLPTFYQFESKRIGSCLKDIQPDIVEAHWTYEYGLAAVKSGYPCVIRIHDWMPNEFRISKEITFILKMFVQKYVLYKSKYLVGPTPYICQLARPHTCAKIFVMPPMVFPAYYELEDQENENVIFSPAGILKRKNTFTLLQVMERLKEKCPDAKLYLVDSQKKSSNAYYDKCITYIKRMKCNNVVIIPGMLDYGKLASYYASASVVVHASVEESFGMVVAEAQAAAKPVVVGKNGGIDFIVQNNETGFIVDPFDINAYVDRLCLLLTDRKMRKEMGDKGRQRTKKLLDSEKIFQDTIQLYRSVIENW